MGTRQSVQKVPDVATTPISISKGVPVATMYSMNNFDTLQIQSLVKPLPQSCAGHEMITLNILEKQTKSCESAQQNHFFFFFSLISFIADGPHHYRPACGH